MWKYFLELLLVTIISFLISIPTWGLFDEKDIQFPFDPEITVNLFFFSFEGLGAYIFIALIFLLLFEWPLEYGISYVYLKAAKEEKVVVKDMFEVFNNYWNAVFANLLVAVIIGFGIAMLIIPGIIFACKLCFVPYLVVERKMDAVQAVRESWQKTSGYSITIFLIGFLVIFVGLLGILFFGVGIIVSIIWIRLAFAFLYSKVAEIYPDLQSDASLKEN